MIILIEILNFSQSGVPQPRSPPAPVEPKNRDMFRSSPDSDFDHFPKNRNDMFSQSRDLFASQQHLRENHEYRMQEIKNNGRDKSSLDFDSRRDLGSDICGRDVFDHSNSKRDPFGMARDVSPKSRDSFGMISARDFGVVPNTRESFAAARQNYKRMTVIINYSNYKSLKIKL